MCWYLIRRVSQPHCFDVTSHNKGLISAIHPQRPGNGDDRSVESIWEGVGEEGGQLGRGDEGQRLGQEIFYLHGWMKGGTGESESYAADEDLVVATCTRDDDVPC